MGMDIWNFSVDDHSLRKAYTLIAQTVIKPEQRPYRERYGMDVRIASSTMHTAYRAYGDPIFSTALAHIKGKASASGKVSTLACGHWHCSETHEPTLPYRRP